MKNLLLFFILIALVFSCSLDKSNPLEPQNGQAPPVVTIPSKPTSTSTYITLFWKGNENDAGYYIYRSLSRDGNYERVHTYNSSANQNLNYFWNDMTVNPGVRYYYKISVFIDTGLEGRSVYVGTAIVDSD